MEDSTPKTKEVLYASRAYVQYLRNRHESDIAECAKRLDIHRKWHSHSAAFQIALVLWCLLNTVVTLCIIVWICTR